MDEAQDPFDLQRFVTVQDCCYPQVLRELRSGRKASHWMWFIFPQLAGLGYSETSKFYGLRSLAEAEAYLSHQVLGARLIECLEALQSLPTNDPDAVLGSIDAAKLRSCLTLFLEVAPANQVLKAALQKWFADSPDPATLKLLGSL